MSKLQTALPWLYWAWCYAHQFELACKDAFSSHLFHDIDDMLLRLYYLEEKSSKKCGELSDLIDDLKVFEFPEGGNLHVQTLGSHWIPCKRIHVALQGYERADLALSHEELKGESKVTDYVNSMCLILQLYRIICGVCAFILSCLRHVT